VDQLTSTAPHSIADAALCRVREPHIVWQAFRLRGTARRDTQETQLFAKLPATPAIQQMQTHCCALPPA